MTILSFASKNPNDRWLVVGSLAMQLSLAPGTTQATPPTLYSQPANESPVRADPGDLLILPGYGLHVTDTVVYMALSDTTAPLNPPQSVPVESTSTSGVAKVVSALNAPHSLVVELPEAAAANQAYGIWVRTSEGEWSAGIRINDARPMWITPDRVYATRSLANLPRYLKVVGRNLQPAVSAGTQVRLTGPASITLLSAADHKSITSSDRYAAVVALPRVMPVGSYTVQVSRDGHSWVTLEGQVFRVLPDPAKSANFAVGDYGCVPNDLIDDTRCILQAIADAARKDGGQVTFGPGVWRIGDSATAGVTPDGIVVPVGVGLVGADGHSTTIERGESWNLNMPAFTLQGGNVITGLRFSDATRYKSLSGATFLRLGTAYYRSQAYRAGDPRVVSNVTITRNVFDRTFVGIADGGLPIDHLFVTYNEFGAYAIGLFPDGNGSNVDQKFHIDDSVIAFNTFRPGSYVDNATGDGTIASHLGAGHRLDFSNNIADGTATQYLYNPSTDARGWRAAFFWALRGNEEMILISNNYVTCPGDKAGDGEAIVFDNNHNAPGFAAVQVVRGATANSVTVDGPFLTQFEGHALPGDYFTEHWVEVAKGPGIGQVRKIVAYGAGSPLTLTVSPPWDVAPQITSLVTVAREVWQSVIVGNVVDQRQPLCTKANPIKPSGGVISYYAQTADSAIEGNTQYDTNGILLEHQYTVPDVSRGTSPGTMFQSFVEVRGNTVDREYAWSSDYSWSGIQLQYGASPTAGFPPPVAGYGESIARNTITQADGLRGGGIVLSHGWYEGPGPAPNAWEFIESPVIFGNTINGISGAAAGGLAPYGRSGVPSPRVGINMEDALVWHPVVFSNTCNDVSKSLSDGATGSRLICSALAHPCECPVGAEGVWKSD
jgi:hypothetical protein